ncbi:hypothetical protein JTE90_021831 [Oedothorax gibbosus]|uniref:Nose resistant-to-fluoxetine protein N-terminal domain-containing protein n=1 Tax=Oedothorax gibbosus TaxID=931172 RepID=A0AAV6UY71_9ARAC|nr:hypothetical protein JTE90_021831 [Oedothorax gibbosus]
MFSLCLSRVFVFVLCCSAVLGKVGDDPIPLKNSTEIKLDTERYLNLTVTLENGFKNVVKKVVKYMMPTLVRMNEYSNLSPECTASLMKFLKGLNQAKIWAVKMLDASSKLPAGFVVGTFADYGSFDECLDIVLPEAEGGQTFQGMSCAIEVKPPLPPISHDYTLVKSTLQLHNGTIKDYFRVSHEALHHKKFRLVACVPSTCSIQDMRQIANRGSLPSILTAFSLSSNLKFLLSSSHGASELRSVHGIRALSMCWIVLGHTYVLMDFELLKDPAFMQRWFAALEFEFVHNGWLAVETFFLLSGALVAYGGLKTMNKTKKTFNVPFLILRRYLRLTPSLLLLMGLVFFVPLLSSGPFWYEHVDPQVESCSKYWWTTLLFISNWYGIDKGCLLSTWYLAVDFQLHIISLLILIIIFKYSKFGLSLLVSFVGISCAAIGLQTILYNVTAAVQLSTVDDEKVMRALNHVHVYLPTHLGPYCIGMVLGYCILKYKEQKISKVCIPVTELHDRMHACVIGHGGPINALLSSSILTPMSRLTYTIYLLHPLVIWTRLGSLRERIPTTHYDFVYEYLANLIVSVALSVPFYLLLESPLSNLDRLIFPSTKSEKDSKKVDSR